MYWVMGFFGRFSIALTCEIIPLTFSVENMGMVSPNRGFRAKSFHNASETEPLWI